MDGHEDELKSPFDGVHVSSAGIEAFARNALTQRELEKVSAHVLVCVQCVDALKHAAKSVDEKFPEK